MFIDKLERRISQNSSEGGGDNEDDFFDHDSHKVATIEEVSAQKNNIDNGTTCKPEQDDGVAPSVEAALTMSPTQAQESLGTRKPTIGQRKPAKKGGVCILFILTASDTSSVLVRWTDSNNIYYLHLVGS